MPEPSRAQDSRRQVFFELISRNGVPLIIVCHRRNTDILTSLPVTGKSTQSAALPIMTYLNLSL